MDRFSNASKGKKLCTVIAVYLGFFATIFFAAAMSIFLPAAGMVLLALTKEQCGVDIMAKVKEMSKGRVSVGPGTLYAMLQKFNENSIVKITRSEGARKWYVITEKGKDMLIAERERLRTQYEDWSILD